MDRVKKKTRALKEISKNIKPTNRLQRNKSMGFAMSFLPQLPRTQDQGVVETGPGAATD